MLRVIAGGVATETNVFSPIPTGLSDFEISRAEAADRGDKVIFGSSLERYAEVAAANGCTYLQGIYAWAQPAGLTTRAAYETLRDELLQNIRDALPLDGVLLTLHGAMVADGYGDCESDLVLRVREIVGERATIGVLLDLHCDLPDELVQTADITIAFKEYPHTDVDERAVELAQLVIAAARGEVAPRTATFDCRMTGIYPTPPGPMRNVVDRMQEAEQRPGILSVSLGHGFPWGDAPTMGARMLVVADGDAELAAGVAEELGREFFARRHEVTLQPLSFDRGLERALSSSKRPVVVADVSDNAGGGAPSDSTFVLRALLEREVQDAALAVLWDPIVVHQAFAAGEGAELTIRLGGKMGPVSGDPLDLTVRVRRLVEDLVQRWPQTEGFVEIPCGQSACLTCNGVDVIVGSVRQQVLGLDVFTAFGIEPHDRRLLVVKSFNHFHAAFAPIAGEIVYMSAPGALEPDPRRVPYELTDTHKFPWLDDPWAVGASSATAKE